jgi:crotonobetainyl-CoA:carnitine CoA-transferase CaiB-like acyl-CoA transferase
MSDQAPLLFEGITIVEIGQYIAAPYAAELFAHGGADVISVEPVDGAPTRHNSPLGPTGEGRQYVNKARGKRALPVALGSDEGRVIVRRLIEDADVVITNLRPTLAGSLGLGWEQLHRERPDLVYAEVRGFGDRGPLAEEACVDIVAQAASGLMRSLGRREEGRGVPSDVMIADFTAGALLAFAIAAALRYRDLTGQGQRVSTSLLAAALTAQHRRASRFDEIDTWHDELTARMAGLTSPGDTAPHSIDDVAEWRETEIGTAPYFYNSYVVADGEVAVGAVAANGPRLLQAAGLDPGDLVDAARLEGMTVTETRDLVATRLIDRRADPLVAELRAAGIPAARVQFLEEALVDPDLVASGVIQRYDHPRLGPVTMPAPPVTFSLAGYAPGTDTPELGRHTDEVLRRLGYEQEVIDRLVADGIVARTTTEPTTTGPTREERR